MALNIFGPYGSGVNPTTTRPTDTGEPGATDTWFQPCSSPTANDGTMLSYRWLNKMLATIRRATRGMGIADDPASDELLFDAIKRGGTVRNIGTGTSLYDGQDADKTHRLRRLAAGSNVTLTTVESPTGEHAVRIAVTVPGSGPTGNTIGNVGDGADIYKGTADDVEELRGIKGIGPVAAAVNGDNIEIGLSGDTATLLMRSAGDTGQASMQSIASLTAETSPADADELLLQKAGGGALRKVTVANARGAVSTGVGSYRISRLGGNRLADSNVTAYMTGSPTGTWLLRGECWQAQYGASGAGEPLFDWYGLCQRTA